MNVVANADTVLQTIRICSPLLFFFLLFLLLLFTIWDTSLPVDNGIEKKTMRRGGGWSRGIETAGVRASWPVAGFCYRCKPNRINETSVNKNGFIQFKQPKKGADRTLTHIVHQKLKAKEHSVFRNER